MSEGTEGERKFALLPKKWKNCRFGSFTLVKHVLDTKTATPLVWPDEGRFSDNGAIWQFNEEHKGFEPLLLDIVTANMLVKAHEAVKPETKQKVEDWLMKSRGHFGKIIEIGWGSVK